MDDKIYFIRDDEQQIPVYDFIKAMNPDAPINPTHNFELLKAHRLKMYDKAEQEYIAERTSNYRAMVIGHLSERREETN